MVSRSNTATNLAQSYGSWTVAMGLLDTAGGWVVRLAGLCGELLARSLASGGLACGLLGAGHILQIRIKFVDESQITDCC